MENVLKDNPCDEPDPVDLLSQLLQQLGDDSESLFRREHHLRLLKATGFAVDKQDAIQRKHCLFPN